MERTGLQYVQTAVLTIDILDQDDNPPVMQGNSSIIINIEDFVAVSLSARNIGERNRALTVCKLTPRAHSRYRAAN